MDSLLRQRVFPMTEHDAVYHEAILVLPHMRIQNANAISGPMTWGFPAITAFVGFMHALARRVRSNDIRWVSVGVICHDFEAQVSRKGFTHFLHLTRNPLEKEKVGGITEEGRIHLDVSLVFLIDLPEQYWPEHKRRELAIHINAIAETMRVAGGTVVPQLETTHRAAERPWLDVLAAEDHERRQQFRRFMSRWLPGFALVSREDLLTARHNELKTEMPAASLLDAWLDLSRINSHAIRSTNDSDQDSATWVRDERSGWIVPMPVGYQAISPLYDSEAVENSRDGTTAFRFVESAYSIGEWVSPHRLHDVADLLWYVDVSHGDDGMYLCRNDYSKRGIE